jgi:hypothetical protein
MIDIKKLVGQVDQLRTERDQLRAINAELLAALELAEPWVEHAHDAVISDDAEDEVGSHLVLIRMAIKHGRDA